ncbi:hypothetical protein ILYODFUR_022779 [Ilyodon furcidens]|uniref:Secreted protein n=1 Tax=Ilyodon furcidens TaxID=33524 RepID=A0ABV0UK85_9TELE
MKMFVRVFASVQPSSPVLFSHIAAVRVLVCRPQTRANFTKKLKCLAIVRHKHGRRTKAKQTQRPEALICCPLQWP